MSDFEEAVEVVLKHEGGYVDHAADPGGATNYGISLRFIKAEGIELDIDGDGDIDAEDIQQMTTDQAKEIYKKHFWDRYKYSQIQDQEIATKIFDMCVNMGPRQAHKIVQRACNNLLEEGYWLSVDGLLGPKSFDVINNLSNPLLKEIRECQSSFYHKLVGQKPQLQVFLKGWLRRASS